MYVGAGLPPADRCDEANHTSNGGDDDDGTEGQVGNSWMLELIEPIARPIGSEVLTDPVGFLEKRDWAQASGTRRNGGRLRWRPLRLA